jgi:GNAT superfamily N-acetyltransferase
MAIGAAMETTMTLTIVTTRQRPDLASVTGTWRWQAFFGDGDTSLAEMLAFEARCAASRDLMPTVLLEDDQPIGMAALCLGDLDDRPDLNPWLAGLYVAPGHRGKGHGRRLIDALEALARQAAIPRLFLYTASAVGLYTKAGWTVVETFAKHGEVFSIMEKHL